MHRTQMLSQDLHSRCFGLMPANSGKHKQVYFKVGQAGRYKSWLVLTIGVEGSLGI